MVNLDALTKTPSLNAVFTKPPLKPLVCEIILKKL